MTAEVEAIYALLLIGRCCYSEEGGKIHPRPDLLTWARPRDPNECRLIAQILLEKLQENQCTNQP